MSRFKTHISLKLLAIFLVLAMIVTILPPAIFASTDPLGLVEGLVSGATVSDNKVVFANPVLEWSLKDAAVGKETDGYWIGIKVTAPAEINAEVIKNAKYKSGVGEARDFWTNKNSSDGDSVHYIELWESLNEAVLNDAVLNSRKIVFDYSFDWDNNGTYEQPISVEINPDNTVLKKDGTQIYPTASNIAEVEAITTGIAVTDSGKNIVYLNNNEIRITKELADISAGKDSDGYWIGYSIIPSKSVTAKSVNYQILTASGWDTGNTGTLDLSKVVDGRVPMWHEITEDYLVDAIETNDNITFTTRYDWDNDGVFEQIITLKIDPLKTVLLDSNGEQVYPYLGTVTPLTGGTLSGNTSNLKLEISKVSLEYLKTGSVAGVSADGWYVGFKVTAPEGIDSDLLENTVYYVKKTTADESGWTSSQMFDFKSTKTAANEIVFWEKLTPEIIEAYEKIKKNISVEYSFDWDGDTVNEQIITLSIVPGSDIVFKKLQQTGFAFVDPAPIDKWVGQTYTNTASGGEGSGAITYSIVSGNEIATINSVSGELSFSGIGTVTVKAIKAADDLYDSAEAVYTVKTYKSAQNIFKFKNSNSKITVAFNTAEFLNIAEGGSGTGAVTYEVIPAGQKIVNLDKNTGKVSFLTAGQVTIKATKAGDEHYEEITTTYILDIEKSEQSKLSFKNTAPSSIAYSKNEKNVFIVEGGDGTGEISYSIKSGSDYASINEKTGAVTTKKAGGSFTVEIVKAADDGYEESEALIATVYVDYAEQNGFKFADSNPGSVKYGVNENIYENKASGGESTGGISYAFADMESAQIADIDAESGIVTIRAAGVIRVRATKLGDDCYKSATIEYLLNVEKGDASFNIGDVELTYGAKEYELVPLNVVGSNNFEYSIIGENKIGASVDNAGKVTFADSKEKVGSITINVKEITNAQYNECIKTLTLSVSYLQTEEKPEVYGESKNKSGWYTGTVTVTAPKGYEISYSNELSTNDWSDKITVDGEGQHSLSVYLKKGDKITDAISLETLKIDTSAPENVKIIYNTPFIEKLLSGITFGIFDIDSVEVTLEATDDISGVNKLTYNLGAEDIEVDQSEFTEVDNGTVKYTFTISAEYRNKVTVVATDVAGWSTRVTESGHVLVVDSINPILTVLHEFSGENQNKGGAIYTNDNLSIKFEIKESNFDIRTNDPVLTIGTITASLIWSYDSERDVWCASQDISGDGTYALKLVFSDASGNAMTEYSETVIIDSKKPVIETYYSDFGFVKDDIYNSSRSLRIKVTETNFDPSCIDVDITAVDINGAQVDISSKKYGEYIKNPLNWTNNGDIHTIILPLFDIDAIYSVDVSCVDLASNSADDYEKDIFVIDKSVTSAEGIKIEYSTPVIEKVIEGVTFGFYKADVKVKVTAEDEISGVDYFEITYTKEAGASDKNAATFTTDRLEARQSSEKKSEFTAEYTIPASARGTVSVNLADKAGNTAEKADKKVIVADNITPTLSYKYTFTNDQVNEVNDIYYTQGETRIEFTIDEANLDLSLKKAEGEEAAATPTITVNGNVQDVKWQVIEGTDKQSATVTLSEDGDYIIAITYKDRSDNEMGSYSKEIHIDGKAPEIEVSYDNNEAQNTNNYKANRIATVKITEHNFNSEDVRLTVTAKDIFGKSVDISEKKYAEYAKDKANWKQSGDVWELDTAGMVFDKEAIYTVRLECGELAENEASAYETEFVIDKSATSAEGIKIEYSTPVIEKVIEGVTFGFYKADVKVKVTAEDEISGVDYFEITYTKEAGASDKNAATFTTDRLEARQSSEKKSEFTAEYTIPASARGTVSVNLADKAGNTAEKADKKVVVVDDNSPLREVIYTPYKVLDATTMLEVESYTEGDNSILYYKDAATIIFKISEQNFDLSLENTEDKPVITVNGKTVNVEWSKAQGDVWVTSYTIEDDGDYTVAMTYKDLSNNEMITYESCKIAIDSTSPIIDVKYSDGVATQERDGLKYYKSAQTVDITVTEHNFLADDVVVEVTAQDIQGNKVNIDSKKYAEYVRDRNNWIHVGDTHKLNTEGMVFDIDAIYSFDISYDDIADNISNEYTQDNFVVDCYAPENIKIQYSESVISKIFAAVTFGFYNPDVTVTVFADDSISGVDYFCWSCIKEEQASAINPESVRGEIYSKDITYTANGMTAKASFVIPANMRGSISVKAVDKSGNNSEYTDSNKIVVVDNVAPAISIEYVATDAETKVQFTDEALETVNTFDEATTAYYNGNVTAKITVNEANFFEGVLAEDGIIHKLGIRLIKTNEEGISTAVEFVPTGATPLYDNTEPVYFDWVSDGDVHTFEISYIEEMDYVLELEYVDFSANDAAIVSNDGYDGEASYVSKTITVDKTAPIVSVEYANANVIHEIDGRKYFDEIQTANITVTEHNFRADDFTATVTAENVIGEAVTVQDFKKVLSDKLNWTRSGDTYTAVIEYSVDANYSFDFVYRDLAQNFADEYDRDLFTVDTTPPENLTVSYSTSVLDKILESVTFGYYNAEMTVTITADDDTSGIYYFVYSYIKSSGVSEVNAELIMDKLDTANRNITYDGTTAIATFSIPKFVLKGDNQFNGTVEFTAYDRSENNAEKVDNKRIVVDNISPKFKITYNEPIRKVNDISYYNGSIDTKIIITEANFYKEDVKVVVTRDDVSYPVAVKWLDENVDVHCGTFTLNTDGDYIVTVKYTDRSGNEMATYKSNRLTIDTKAPTVNVTNIKNNSANKDEHFGFSITANDINIDETSFNPILTEVVRNSDGTYETKTVSLGEMKTVESGKTYTYIVDNLTEDAVYKLVCSLKDMSDNSYSKIRLDDGNEYDEVRFSINRNGSTFSVDESTDKLVNKYYVFNVYDNVVIEEINVDPVEEYTVKLNGNILKEGSDYTTTLTNKEGEWSKRTYIILKSLFEAEGEYNVVVESTDKTATTAYSDVKNLKVKLVVDKTAPALTISGLENGGRYQVQEQTVTVIPTDDGGRLYSMKVIVLDSNGEPIKDAAGADISIRFEMSGDEFRAYLDENGGKLTFTVPEGLENQVQIICNDCAYDADGHTNEYNKTFTKITVSQSGWVIFYANKTLFYCSIAGGIALAGAATLLVFLKKRKKEKKK